MAFRTNKMPVLQEKSASGSVATFNTALAMSLTSCNIAVTATQSGSGTPSPQNIRSINGYSAINIGSDDKYAGFINFNQIVNGCTNSTTQDGLIITNNNDGSVSISGTAEASGIAYLTNGFSVPRDNSVILFNCVFSSALSEDNYLYLGGYGANYAMTERGCFFKRDEGTNWNNAYVLRYYQDTTINTRIWFNTHNLTRMFGQSKADEIYQMEQQTAGSGVAYFRSLFPNDYYDYNAGTLSTVSAVNGSTNSFFTINLGGTYYGGEYDARTGVLTVTHGRIDLGSVTWNRYTNSYKTYFRTNSEIPLCKPNTSVNRTHGLTCSIYLEGAWGKVVDSSGYDNQFALGWGNKSYIAIHDDSKSSLSADDFKTAMSGETLVFPLATPQTIQLPPCPIDTLQGVNNIWADTGDISLTYKDLDIAKRGNFREVFKLPS